MKAILMRKFENLDGESWFGLLIWLTLLMGIITFFSFLRADKMVRCYYLHSSMTEVGTNYKILSDIDWADDTVAFNSGDYKATMEVFDRLPQCRKQ